MMMRLPVHPVLHLVCRECGKRFEATSEKCPKMRDVTLSGAAEIA
jgi:hypothetical protein